ncbi:pantoate--beta-alanine ligase [Candidatus Woesebacteria bacterium]|nr:pantoate--beta-alanine ligase [Candidatus Woesebacteria bacterium]
MKVCADIKTLKQKIKEYGLQRKSIGFIPTMGALHAGHLSLIQQARKENDIVVVSVFVNPKQFTNPDDLLRYPRTLERDTALIEGVADVLFSPAVEEVYPEGSDTTVEVGELGRVSEGIYRPGHFNGMATVVLKLFNIIKPNRAYFGKKDYQQYLIVQHMVRDLNLEIVIVGCETLRSPTGLALSSRNTRLSEEEQGKARVIYRALASAQKIVRAGEQSVLKVRERMSQVLSFEPSWKTEYIEIRSIEDFLEVQNIDSDVAILIAGYIGEVRLIDNMEVKV